MEIKSSDLRRNILSWKDIMFERLEIFLEQESSQLPLLIPVSVGIGIALWFAFGSDYWSIFVIPLIVVIALSYWSGLHQRKNIIAIVVGLSIIVGWCAISIRSYQVESPILSKPWVGELHGRIVKIEKLPARSIVRLSLETDNMQSLPSKIRINMKEEDFNSDLINGSIIKSRVRLLPPAGPAVPGAYDFAQKAWFERLGATGSVLGEITLVTQASRNADLTHIRQKLAEHVREQMSGRAGSIGATLATGDRGAIDIEDADAMRRSGMAHLLAISGLHVTEVVAISFFCMAKILSLFPAFALKHRVPVYAASLSALMAIFYTILTGAQVPTIRACIAACLILTALILGREPFTLRLVGFGALCILLLWPEVLVGPSFQLSFAAVASIITLHETRFMKKLAQRRDEFWVKAIGRFYYLYS